ncbi:hypothetical protein BV25DRAFT_1840921 [Artomyces pyxidatus]|uniref:Uncharacterized protein n=1 Tax=Artomyces pyxidatus TaxID=48021 RepID=A0ACB8SRE3_9AGAM|nr:hypothetical protein BV25DRAFT_1840921 [Artomyces pyxidatus]
MPRLMTMNLHGPTNDIACILSHVQFSPFADLSLTCISEDPTGHESRTIVSLLARHYHTPGDDPARGIFKTISSCGISRNIASPVTWLEKLLRRDLSDELPVLHRHGDLSLTLEWPQADGAPGVLQHVCSVLPLRDAESLCLNVDGHVDRAWNAGHWLGFFQGYRLVKDLRVSGAQAVTLFDALAEEAYEEAGVDAGRQSTPGAEGERTRQQTRVDSPENTLLQAAGPPALGCISTDDGVDDLYATTGEQEKAAAARCKTVDIGKPPSREPALFPALRRLLIHDMNFETPYGPAQDASLYADLSYALMEREAHDARLQLLDIRTCTFDEDS